MIPEDLTPYELTPSQIADGWTCENDGSSIIYRHQGRHHDPYPGVPACQEWHENGQLSMEAYYPEGKLHDPEPGVPAYQKWYKNGEKRFRSYYQQNLFQDPKPGVPAEQHWYRNGQEKFRMHYREGNTQDPKPGVPAYQRWRENGQERCRIYYDNGRRIAAEESIKDPQELAELYRSLAHDRQRMDKPEPSVPSNSIITIGNDMMFIDHSELSAHKRSLTCRLKRIQKRIAELSNEQDKT